MSSIQEGVAGRALSLINGAIIFGFSASLILIPQAHWWFGVAALISSLLACIVLASYKTYPFVFTADDYKLVGALVLFGSVWWWSVIDSGSLPFVAEEGVHHLYLWPFVAAFFLLAVRVFTPSPYWLWLGICCGAVGAGMIAVYQRVIIGLARADNGINAIPFGNLSLLMAVISLGVGIYYLQFRRQLYYWLALIAISAAFLGFLASLLSGTRGGWLAIPLLGALLLLATKHSITPRVRNIGLLFITMVAVAIIAYPPSGVWLRLVEIYDDIYQYFINNDADNSLGIRFELWRAGWTMFVEHPIFGVGEGSVRELLPSLVAEEVAEEVAYERGLVYPQLHSDIIDTLARRGLLGVFSLFLLYAVFAWVFAKQVLQANDDLRTHLLAISGLMVVTAFFGFGLTQAMFRDLRGFSGFLGFSIVLWGCLCHQTQSGAPNKSR